MQLDLKKLFVSEGKSFPLDFTITTKQDLFYPSDPQMETTICVKGNANNYAQTVQIDFAATMPFEVPCDRCLTLLHENLSFEFSHVLTPEEIDSFEEGIIVDDDKLDLDRLVISDIQLDFPLKFLCCEECEGLCPTCGANLNKEKCDCNKNNIDPRLEALKELLQ